MLITDKLLRGWPLPEPLEESDKEGRGRVLVVGGSSEVPGALVLAATGSLRAGAGKLRIATVKSRAPFIAAAMPESRVISLNETKTGAIAPGAARRIAEEANKVQSVLIGPGMIGEDASTRLMKATLPRIEQASVILDAEALVCLSEAEKFLYKVRCQLVVTPHAEEMSEMMCCSKEAVERDREGSAARAAQRFRAVVALKGRETIIASPDGKMYTNRAGNVGLATSGSGDVLSGIIAGLVARGAPPLQATVWGVYLHARAGDRLAESIGPLGFLARELPAEIPLLMKRLNKERKS